MKKVKKPQTKKKTARKAASSGSSKWKSTLYRVRFLPAIALATFATVLAWQPQLQQSKGREVLAYATNVSPSGLLTATNAQRANSGVAGLSSNSLLASAAQAKAQDMVNRNYWSHTTPDGQQPWVFITNAGYQYASAGENLAYGFLSSGDTITGWMNSAPHKQNLLSTNFTEVGFGIANSPNFVGDGEQTVVVAMYGKPQAVSAPVSSSPAQAKTKAASPKPATPAPVSEPAPEPVPTETIPAEEPKKEDEEVITTAITEPIEPLTASPASIQRLQLFGAPNPFVSTTVVIISVCGVGILWLLHKGIRFKRYLVASERFVLHHLHLDLTVLAVVYLGFVLLSNVGAVR